MIVVVHTVTINKLLVRLEWVCEIKEAIGFQAVAKQMSNVQQNHDILLMSIERLRDFCWLQFNISKRYSEHSSSAHEKVTSNAMIICVGSIMSRLNSNS